MAQGGIINSKHAVVTIMQSLAWSSTSASQSHFSISTQVSINQYHERNLISLLLHLDISIKHMYQINYRHWKYIDETKRWNIKPIDEQIHFIHIEDISPFCDSKDEIILCFWNV